MLFNSLDFAVFLPIVFVLYWFVTQKNIKLQNLLILVTSCVFYGWWDWRFLALLFISSLVDYSVGIALLNNENEKRRKIFLAISICVNLGLLAFFKYFNFFLDSFIQAFSFFGVIIQARTLNIILPVGISFYTFQTLSYGIDVYRRKIIPTKDFIAFFAYVSFFPQLVAGPIERAVHLLPQFYTKRTINYKKAIDGCFQILWGLFKKVVIADNAADLVGSAFNNPAANGSVLLMGVFFFAFQIYCDFSGYSDMAIGLSRLFGFDLMTNFRFPYLSRDIAEFWRRWHISLSTWFRDYLYIPLGGNTGGMGRKIRNIIIIFVVSGFWHGADWKFIVWGALNAAYFIPLLLLNRNRKNLEVVAMNKLIPSIYEIFSILFTFGITLIAWVFFRANSVSHALLYIRGIFSKSLFTLPKFVGEQNSMMFFLILMIGLLMVMEWLYRKEEYVFDEINSKSILVQVIPVVLLVAVIFVFGGSQQSFIYFQF